MQTIVLGSGCFWCTESVFLQIKGVTSVTSGYMGGDSQNANYQAVCTGDTGHIEVIQIVFDNQIIDLATLLTIFFATHDPTTIDRQGNDVGSQYRSAIFYADDTQKNIAENMVKSLQKQGINVVTQIRPSETFYPAESYHQNFFAKNPSQGYCNFVIPPKLAKLRQYFGEYLKL